METTDIEMNAVFPVPVMARLRLLFLLMF